jgi:CheY-like chemotaxis protein
LVQIEWKVAKGVWDAFADQAQLELALVNLIINARDAMPDGGTVTIAAENHKVETDELPGLSGDFVRIAVIDGGTGISGDDLEKVMEPFFTTKDVGKGSGLGLPQVYGFAQQSGGRLDIESEVGKGTVVILQLPRSKSEPAAWDDAPTPAPVRGDARRGVALLVEDDAEVAALTREMLGHLGFEVIHAASPAAALGALANARRVDVVFSDIMMPGGMSGLELGREIRRRQPDLRIVLTTGYSEAAAAMDSAEFTLLLKPYSLDGLSQALGIA